MRGWAVLVLLAGLAHAQALPEREFGEPWNGVGFGARAIGMGGAYTAVADDIDALWWNPGGLVRMRDTQVAVATGDGTWARHVKIGQGTSAFLPLSGVAFATSAFKPWVAGLGLISNFHPESLMPWQDDYAQGTFVLPMNQARTAGIGINLKYVFSDLFYLYPYVGETDRMDALTGWAADVGMLYSIPMPLRDRRREINIGAVARNLVGRSRQVNTEKILPAQAQLGLSFVFDDLVPRERSIIAWNYDTALRSGLGGADTQMRLGFEQYFFQNNAGVRVGYASPVPRYAPERSGIVARNGLTSGNWTDDGGASLVEYLTQGRPEWTAGLSIHLFNVQVNLGVTLPTETIKTEKLDAVPETGVLRSVDLTSGARTIKPISQSHVYLSLVVHLGVAPRAPWAKVAVEPLVFAPKKGEVAVFTIDYKDERGIEFWSVEIKNSARVPVRVYSGKGAPPERLAWDGLDDRFNLTPDDDHTYTLTVRNRDRVETITAPQSLRVFTPGEDHKSNGDDTLLRKILEETAKREKADKEAVRPLIKGQVIEMKAPLGAGETAPPAPGEPPGGPEAPVVPVAPTAPSATPVQAPADASATPYAVYRGITPDQVVRLEVPGAGAKSEQVVLDYNTRQYVLKYLVREVKSLTQQTFANVGSAGKSFLVQARYGNHLLMVETPMELARGLRDGRYDEKVWVRQAKMSLDGRPIVPELD